MIDEFQFKAIDASMHPQHVQKLLRGNLKRLLDLDKAVEQNVGGFSRAFSAATQQHSSPQP
jgi:hypothetical protein